MFEKERGTRMIQQAIHRRSTRGTRSVFGLLGLLSLFATAGSASENPEDLKSRVLREYPLALRSMEDFGRNVHGSGMLTQDFFLDNPEKHYVWKFKLDFSRVDDMKMFTRNWVGESAEGKVIREVSCRNDKYAFLLKWFREEEPVVRYRGLDMKAAEEDYNQYIGKYIGASHYILNMPISRMISDPSFAIRQVIEVPQNGKKLLRIEYDYQPKDLILRSGWLLVSPEDHWALQEYECALSEKFKGRKIRGSIQYGPPMDGFSIPSSITFLPNGNSRDCFVFDAINRGDTPRREFTLPAFGLPEFDVRPSAGHVPYGRYLMFALAALALGIAITVKYLEKRSRRFDMQ